MGIFPDFLYVWSDEWRHLTLYKREPLLDGDWLEDECPEGKKGWVNLGSLSPTSFRLGPNRLQMLSGVSHRELMELQEKAAELDAIKAAWGMANNEI